ncbi:MAG TPA: hypothetical protein VID24_03360 [Candidatus Eremiobacteraceae bacterium]|jgi:hypothetical protein
MTFKHFAAFATIAAASQLAVASAATTNLLANPDFAQVSTSGEQTTLAGAGATGDSAAEHWTVYNTGAGNTTTELMPSTRGGGKSMIHVVTTDDKPNSGSGLVQAFLPVGTGPGHVTSSAWIFIKTGTVFIGTGNGGNTGIDSRTAVTGKWIELKARNGVSPANMFIIYGQSPGADFYVDSASVAALAPGTPASVRVTKAYLNADPVEYVGHCPTTIHFYGTVSANGPTSVLLSFKRSDGSYVAQPKLVFSDAGSRPVQMSWRVGNYYAPSRVYPAWAEISIAQPNALTSNKARFSVTCKNT